MLFVCSLRSRQLPHNIVWGQGGLKGQARRAKMDHSDEIGVKRVNVSTILLPIVVTGKPRYLSQSFVPFLLFYSDHKHPKYIGGQLNNNK